jgi:hypothetical protein
MKANKKEFETMLSVYKSQRLAAIEAPFSKSEFGIKGHEGILLYNSNKNWIINSNPSCRPNRYLWQLVQPIW